MRRRVLSALASVVALLTVAAQLEAGPKPRRQGDLLDRAVAAWSKVKTARATF